MSEASEYYRDKVAVVTGGASGIGLALAEAMLFCGARNVVLADFNDENLQRETARVNATHPGKLIPRRSARRPTRCSRSRPASDSPSAARDAGTSSRRSSHPPPRRPRP